MDFSLKTCIAKLGYSDIKSKNSTDYQSNSTNFNSSRIESTNRPAKERRNGPPRPPPPQMASKPIPTIIRPVSNNSSLSNTVSRSSSTISSKTPIPQNATNSTKFSSNYNATNESIVSNQKQPKYLQQTAPITTSKPQPLRTNNFQSHRPIVPIKPSNYQTSNPRYGNIEETSAISSSSDDNRYVNLDDEFGAISSSDNRYSNDNFTVSPFEDNRYANIDPPIPIKTTISSQHPKTASIVPNRSSQGPSISRPYQQNDSSAVPGVVKQPSRPQQRNNSDSFGSVVRELKGAMTDISKQFREVTGSSKQGVVYSTQPPQTTINTPTATVHPTVNPNSQMSTSNSSGVANCLECRDFREVDAHAANFPRQIVSSLSNLAYDLCSLFPSKTDKARAIFIWLHHNIAYDYVALFSNNVKQKSPEETLRTGLAVCQGYADLFASLARFSGLEAIVVSGHGKGFGYKANTNGIVPPYKSTHAWNAVQMDSGQWHLIDACWGAGHLDESTNTYQKHLDTKHFTSTPEVFGLRHFPTNSQYQFSSFNMSWEEYIMMKDRPLFFKPFGDKGFSEVTIQPHTRIISPKPNTKFTITTRCQHKGIHPRDQDVLLLDVDGVMTPFEVNSSGTIWTCETWSIRIGSKVSVLFLSELRGKPAIGVSVREYLRSKGSSAMSFGGLCQWDVL